MAATSLPCSQVALSGKAVEDQAAARKRRTDVRDRDVIPVIFIERLWRIAKDEWRTHNLQSEILSMP